MKIILRILVFLFISTCNGQLLSKSLSINQKVVAINDTVFVDIKDFDATFVLDMKYATTSNFLKTKVYECASCYLRYKTVVKLLKISKILSQQGVKIKLFDCYRPLDVQKKMWRLVSNPNYVANPAKGSIHNKGCAIDMTLVDASGADFDMGTPFDFFGIEASHNYQKMPDNVKNNRIFLKNIMLSNGFEAFDSEWWHYNLREGLNEKNANFKWQCN